MNGETISCLEYAYHSGMWALVTSSGSVWLDRGRADAESSKNLVVVIIAGFYLASIVVVSSEYIAQQYTG